MYFKLGNGAAWFTFCVMCLFFASVKEAKATQLSSAATTTFDASPSNCVTLRQGRQCFTTVSLVWQVDKPGNYCILRKSTGQTLQCWRNAKASRWIFEFQSTEKIEYQLVEVEQNKIIAETSINVSWVHKATPRKRRWRLF